jgi:hypothetical protein
VTEDDVKASLAELRDLPSHVLGATASTISTLLAEARVHGPETVVDRLIAQRQRSMARHVLEEALSLAGDASRRREFLTRFATETPDYSPERGTHSTSDSCSRPNAIGGKWRPKAWQLPSRSCSKEPDRCCWTSSVGRGGDRERQDHQLVGDGKGDSLGAYV